MCGIAGLLVGPRDYGVVDVAALTRLLGLEIESRGKDATGVARLNHNNKIKIAKRPIPAKEFFAQRAGDFGAESKAVLIHTRAATQGPPSIHANNHPLWLDNIIGIHNGMLYNDFELYKEHPDWPDSGTVDSAALFAAISRLGRVEGLEAADGTLACAWLNLDDPGALYLARGRSSPLNIAFTDQGTVVFASTPGAVKKALEAMGRTSQIVTMSEGVSLRIDFADDGGVQVDRRDFKPHEHVHTYAWNYGSGHELWAPTRPTKGPVSTNVAGSTWIKAAESATGGGEYVLEPGMPVAYVPVDDFFPVVYGTYRRLTWKGNMAYVTVLWDAMYEEDVIFPLERLWPTERVPVNFERGVAGDFLLAPEEQDEVSDKPFATPPVDLGEDPIVLGDSIDTEVSDYLRGLEGTSWEIC